MKDYVYPSIYFSYFFFFLSLAVALFFFLRSYKHGYWGHDSEEPKHRMLHDDSSDGQ